MEELKIEAGLWSKQSKAGNTYYSGKIKIEDKIYYVNLFKSTSDNPAAPEYRILLNEFIEKQEPIEWGA